MMLNNETLFASLADSDVVYDFYGVDFRTFCIGLGDTRIAFEVLEDESDGYRSYLDCVRVSEVGSIFFSEPIAQVKIKFLNVTELSYKFDGYVLEDARSGHNWLELGTDNSDDYYPLFHFEYNPIK